MNLIKKIASSGLVWLWITILMIAVDHYTKILAINNLAYQEPLQVLPFFNLHLAYNTGAAFSFLHSASGWQNWFLGGLAVVISLVILVWLSRLPARAYWLNIALCLILAGAIGNAWDRVSYSYVIDFLSFHWGSWYFAIFNIADSIICVGGFMVVIHWLMTKTD